MIRIQEGCWYAHHLAQSGISEEKPADEWIRFLTIDSWHEVLVYKWHILYSRHYKK